MRMKNVGDLYPRGRPTLLNAFARAAFSTRRGFGLSGNPNVEERWIHQTLGYNLAIPFAFSAEHLSNLFFETCGQRLITPHSLPSSQSNSDRSYQGCYRHSWAEFELANNPIVHFSNTSRESCREHCVDDFAYYALEFGFICSCGSSLPDESRMATKSDCSLVRPTNLQLL